MKIGDGWGNCFLAVQILNSMNESKSELFLRIQQLTARQLELLNQIVEQFSSPYIKIEHNSLSNILDEKISHDLGDTLRIHHCFSHEPFTKDKFEYALERVLLLNGKFAQKASMGNPGHDLLIEGFRFNLKTQADRSIRENSIHISKFMELGKGYWTDKPEELIELRKRYLDHLSGYDRILTLRCLDRGPKIWKYELVEIPKLLLEEAINGSLRMMMGSKQMPKPGYCDVFDTAGGLKYQLYFDGGTERKLQIKKLDINLCVVHGTWIFERIHVS